MAVALATLTLVACTSGPRGLGKGACPYLRPRLIRLDTDRLHLPGSLPDVTALSEDVSDYVRTNLPDDGKAKSDQPLVRRRLRLSDVVLVGYRADRPLGPGA